MDKNSLLAKEVPKKFLILIWLVVTLCLMAFEPWLVNAFPPDCTYWICFGWSLNVVLVLNYILLVSVLALIVPMFGWKILRFVVIAVAAFALLVPFNVVMAYPSKLIHQMIMDAKIRDYENHYPRITITSPAPDTIFEGGKSYQVTWETKNITADATIHIGGIGFEVGGDFPNSGHATLKMPNRFSDYGYDCSSACSIIMKHTLAFSYNLPDEVIQLHAYSTKQDVLYTDIPTVTATTTVKLIDPLASKTNQVIRKDMDILRSKVVALYTSKKGNYENLCFHDGRNGIDISALGGNSSLWVAVDQLAADKYYKEGNIERSGPDNGIICLSDKNTFALSVNTVPSDDGPVGYCFDSTQGVNDPLIIGWVDRKTNRCVPQK